MEDRASCSCWSGRQLCVEGPRSEDRWVSGTPLLCDGYFISPSDCFLFLLTLLTLTSSSCSTRGRRVPLSWVLVWGGGFRAREG